MSSAREAIVFVNRVYHNSQDQQNASYGYAHGYRQKEKRASTGHTVLRKPSIPPKDSGQTDKQIDQLTEVLLST